MKKLIVLALLTVLCAAPVQARTLKDVMQTTTATDIATGAGFVVGVVVKTVCNLITLPFHLMEKAAR